MLDNVVCGNSWTMCGQRSKDLSPRTTCGVWREVLVTREFPREINARLTGDREAAGSRQ